jgi:transcriptional regulator with XRE-family HTH domain
MKKIKKKNRRSDTKIMTREATVLKIMRESRKLSMRRAAVLVGVSDTFINHLEHGRLDLNPEIIHKLLIAYGYSYEEFIKFQDPRNELPEAIRHECLEIIKRLSFEKLKTVKAILQSF